MEFLQVAESRHRRNHILFNRPVAHSYRMRRIGFFSSFIYAIYFLIKTILYGDQAAGFPTLIVVILFLGGIQLFSLGVIGEYIGRIFKETKGRPTYIASDYNETKLGYDQH